MEGRVFHLTPITEFRDDDDGVVRGVVYRAKGDLALSLRENRPRLRESRSTSSWLRTRPIRSSCLSERRISPPRQAPAELVLLGHVAREKAVI